MWVLGGLVLVPRGAWGVRFPEADTPGGVVKRDICHDVSGNVQHLSGGQEAADVFVFVLVGFDPVVPDPFGFGDAVDVVPDFTLQVSVVATEISLGELSSQCFLLGI